MFKGIEFGEISEEQFRSIGKGFLPTAARRVIDERKPEPSKAGRVFASHWRHLEISVVWLFN